MGTPIRTGLLYRTRASTNDGVIASSMAALRSDTTGEAPLLWFPLEDVALDELQRLPPGAWRKGGTDLDGYVAFDHEQVDLVIVDGRDGDKPNQITTKRFPNWGDTADLIELLDVKGDSAHFHSRAHSDWRRPVVEGSQILGQAVVAACRLAPGRRIASASMLFTRPADAGLPYAIELDELAGGRTFSAFAVQARQGNRICAAGNLLLGVTAADAIRHGEGPPEAGGPYDWPPYDMAVTGRDIRMVDDAYTGDPDAPVGPPELDAWVRYRDVPDDQPLHVALLAQFTGHLSIAAALRPHPGVGQDQAHRTLSTAINAISLSIHADVHADRWMLYHHVSTFAGDGMTHSECRVHDEAGALVASFTVEAMVREFADPSKVPDPRTAM